MKIINAEQIRKVDAYTIEHEPINSIDLMERAAHECYLWIREYLGNCMSLKIFVGPGNNGGDGLALARLLSDDENTIEVYMLTTPDKLSVDAAINYERISKIKRVKTTILDEYSMLPEIYDMDIVIDALFGTGLTRPLEGLAAKVVKHINQSDATRVSIDLPSGLYSEGNSHEKHENIVHADYTLTFQFPKLAFFFPENALYTGEWTVLDISLIPEAINLQDSKYFTIDNEYIAFKLHERGKFSHKGSFGHALLLAGSYGKMGASVLASKACLRTGVGLLTTHIVAKGYEIMQTAVPEAMVSIDPTMDYISSVPDLSKYTAIGIGPGIGTNDFTGFVLHKLLKEAATPMVLDADALNLIANHKEWLRDIPENTIITPHPGEFDRLTGPSANGYERHLKQLALSLDYKIIVILKGAYTSISAPDGRCWFNETGNPGMATAGSGDVLTGMVLSLLAQGYQPMQAALTAVYLHGMAGDIACEDTGMEALLSSDIINNIGKAFMNVRVNEFNS